MTVSLETLEAVDAWLDDARTRFYAGSPIHLTFSPGDGTRYAVSFTPGGDPASKLVTAGDTPEVGRSLAVGSMISGGAPVAWVFTTSGAPHPYYVAEKIRSENLPTIAAVGIVWALLVHVSLADLASWYGPDSPFGVCTDWKIERFLP